MDYTCEMNFKKYFATVTGVVILLSLTACRKEKEPIVFDYTKGSENLIQGEQRCECLMRELPEAGKVIDFSDEATSFAMVNDISYYVDSEYSMEIEQVAEQNVLSVSRPNGMDIMLGIDISSLLGESVSKCRYYTVDIGILRDDFASASGCIYTYTGENNNITTTAWTIYSADETCKTVTVELPEEGFVAGAGNIFVVRITEDAGFAAESEPCTVYIDNIIAYDENGNPLNLNTAAVMNPPIGFGEYDWSNNVVQPAGEVEWSINGVSTDEVYGKFQGCMIVMPEMFDKDYLITVYYEKKNEVLYNEWQTPFLTLEISSQSYKDLSKYTYFTMGGSWQKINIYCCETLNLQGDISCDEESFVNISNTICQFTAEQIDAAVYNALYNENCPDYNVNLTEEVRADYYANWRNYVKEFAINDMSKGDKGLTENGIISAWYDGIDAPFELIKVTYSATQ